MKRILGLLMVAVFASQNILAQDKVRERAGEIIAKLRRDAYPQPYNERLALTIDEVSPLEIAYLPEQKRNVGSQMKFRAMLKNTGKEDFEFIPGDFLVAVVSEHGVQLPVKDIVWNENAHGDSGAYRIKPGESNGRYIRLGIGDFSANVGTKYFVVVTYLHIYDKPAPAIDSLVTVLPVEVVVASETPKDQSAKK